MLETVEQKLDPHGKDGLMKVQTVSGDIEVRDTFLVRVLGAIQETPNQTAYDIAKTIRCDFHEVIVAIEELRDKGIDIYARSGLVGVEYSLGGLR